MSEDTFSEGFDCRRRVGIDSGRTQTGARYSQERGERPKLTTAVEDAVKSYCSW